MPTARQRPTPSTRNEIWHRRKTICFNTPEDIAVTLYPLTEDADVRRSCDPHTKSDVFPLHDVRHWSFAVTAKRTPDLAGQAKLLKDETGAGDPHVWWSQTGSNRRPHACKARALPTELWPRAEVVGLGRLELPTSRLSSARSNQLSYKPEPLQATDG